MKKCKSILSTTLVVGVFLMQCTFSNAQKASSAKPVSKEAIRPFPKFHASQAELDDLKRRILATRWPEKETVNDQTQGVPLATMKALANYWATEYDWRKVEAK